MKRARFGGPQTADKPRRFSAGLCFCAAATSKHWAATALSPRKRAYRWPWTLFGVGEGAFDGFLAPFVDTLGPINQEIGVGDDPHSAVHRAMVEIEGTLRFAVPHPIAGVEIGPRHHLEGCLLRYTALQHEKLNQKLPTARQETISGLRRRFGAAFSLSSAPLISRPP